MFVESVDSSGRRRDSSGAGALGQVLIEGGFDHAALRVMLACLALVGLAFEGAGVQVVLVSV